MNHKRETAWKAIKTVLSPSMYSKMLVTPNAACVCSNCVRRLLNDYAYAIKFGWYDDAKEPLTVLDMSMVDGGVHCDKCSSLINDHE
jgi:hypothetical protein